MYHHHPISIPTTTTCTYINHHHKKPSPHSAICSSASMVSGSVGGREKTIASCNGENTTHS